MRKVIRFLRAIGKFIETLFAPSVPIVSYSENGHPILESWNSSPEEKVIAQAERLRGIPEGTPRLGLFCFEGPHRGELMLLRNHNETLGRELSNTVVLSPDSKEESKNFCINLGHGPVLMAEAGTQFRVNGSEHFKTDLFDYDEVELMGNKFLILDCEDALKSQLPQRLGKETQ